MYKLVFPEVVGSVLNEFYECDEESPGVGPVHYQPLQENTVLDRGRGWGNLVYTHTITRMQRCTLLCLHHA